MSLYLVVYYIDWAMENKLFTLGIFLHIEGEFDKRHKEGPFAKNQKLTSPESPAFSSQHRQHFVAELLVTNSEYSIS